MNMWLVLVVLLVSGAAAIATIVLLVRDEPVGDVVYGSLAVIEVLLLVQMVVGLVKLSGADVHTATFLGYLFGIVCVLPLGFFWSLAERNRAGTAVLMVSLLTVLALEVRLDAIWGGTLV